MKVSSIGLLATGAIVYGGTIITRPLEKELPNPYPVLPDRKPVIAPPTNSTRFFNDHQYIMVATLAAIIIPTDEEPGATEAGVVDYIDRLVAQSKKKQTEYVKGLNWTDNLSQKEYGKNFLSLKVKEQIRLLRLIDEAESMYYRPVYNLIERIYKKVDIIWDNLFGIGDITGFFKKIRRDVFYGYYSNPISWKVVGYYGPPQPIGYPGYFKPPSVTNYIDTVRQIDNNTCQGCHFDELQKDNHKDGNNISFSNLLSKFKCTNCHKSHFPLQGEK